MQLPDWLSPGATDLLLEQSEEDQPTILAQIEAIRNKGKKTNTRTVKKAMHLLGMEVDYEANDSGVKASAEARASRKGSQIWTAVEKVVAATGCRCGLTDDMTAMELRTMRGCKDIPPDSVGQGSGRYVCPALDTYRRRLGVTSS